MKTLSTFVIVLLLGLGIVACSGDDEGGGVGGNASGVSNNAVHYTPLDTLINTEYLSFLSVSLNTDWRSEGTITSDYNNYKGALPSRKASTFSGNASRQSTNFAFRMCNKRYREESSGNRIVFRFLNFSAAPSIGAGGQSESQVRAALTHLFYRFTGRSPRADEMTILLDAYNSHASLAANETFTSEVPANPVLFMTKIEEVMTYMCALIGSSVQAMMREGKGL